jgi:hypothetical protein
VPHHELAIVRLVVHVLWHPGLIAVQGVPLGGVALRHSLRCIEDAHDRAVPLVVRIAGE